MLPKKMLLAIGLGSMATFATAVAQDARGPAVTLPEQTLKISHAIEIGELRNQLQLDLKVRSSLEMQDQRAYLDVNLSEPDLYSKLLDAFTSHAESGCSMIHRQGEGAGAVEAQLCQMRKLSIGFDRQKRSGALRARARMRSRTGGVESQASDHDIALETSVRFKEGSIVLRPVSLDIEGLPSDADQLLLGSFEEFSFFLHRCLSGSDLEIEQLKLEEGANQVKIRASSGMADSVRMLSCFAAEGIMDLQGRVP